MKFSLQTLNSTFLLIDLHFLSVYCLLQSLYFEFVFSLDAGYLAVELGLHLVERCLEAGRVIRLHLVYKSIDAVMAVLSFPQVLVLTKTTNHIGLGTISKHV